MMILTVGPCTSSSTDNFTVICLMIYDSPDAQAHHSERGHVFGRLCIRLQEGVDIFRVRHCSFDFTPRNLLTCSVSSEVKMPSAFIAYPLILNNWILNLKPARTINLALKNQQLECTCTCTENAGKVGATYIVGDLGF
jgi:hypothetical protein